MSQGERMSPFGVLTPALIRAYEAGGHSVFRPSAASRWMVCPGSVRAEIAAQADTAGHAAAQGTVCHAISDFVLRKGRRPKWAVVGNVRTVGNFEIVITEEMLSWVEQYVEWVEALGPADHIDVERRVDFSDLTPIPNQGGTADHIHIRGNTLTITDAKFGVVVRVYARGNKQAQLYAYGAWREWSWAYDIRRIVIRICQPRLDVFEEWTVSVEDLLAFAEEAKRKAHQAWQDNPPLHPDPNACRYCTVQAVCPAMVAVADAMLDAVLDDLDDLDDLEVDRETVSADLVRDNPDFPFEPLEFNTPTLARLLRWRRTFEAWFRSIHDELQKRVEKGEEADGWEIEESITKRAWRDEGEVVGVLMNAGLEEDEIYEPRKVRSPKQIEDLMRAKRMKPAPLMKTLAVKPKGRLSLVQSGRGQQSALDSVLDDLD